LPVPVHPPAADAVQEDHLRPCGARAGQRQPGGPSSSRVSTGAGGAASRRGAGSSFRFRSGRRTGGQRSGRHLRSPPAAFDRAAPGLVGFRGPVLAAFGNRLGIDRAQELAFAEGGEFLLQNAALHDDAPVKVNGAVAHRQVKMTQREAPGILVGAGGPQERPGQRAKLHRLHVALVVHRG